jgi:hypothetical protein
MLRLLPRLRRAPAPAPRPRVEPTVTWPQRAPMRVSLSALAASLSKPAPLEPKVNPFQLPRYPKGVLPGGRTELAMDENTTQIVASAWDFGAAIHGLWAEGIGFMGYPYLAELSQRAEYRRASEVIAEEMTRKWIKLKATGENDKTDKIKVLNQRLDQFKVREAFREALEHDGFFGLGFLLLDFDDDDAELRTPLAITPEKIGRHRLRAIRVVDPTWTAPNRYDARDPTSPSFYRPQSWFVMGREIHATRMMSMVSRPLPDILKPAFNFGGLSLSQMMKPYVDNWLRTRQSVSDLINAFTVFNLSTNLEGLLAGAGGEAENQRLEIMTNIRSNRGMLVTDKNTEELKNISAPLGTLDHLQAQSQEHICSVIAVPLVKYLGVTPSGLNASADGEIRVFYDGIKARQEKVCGDRVRTILRVLQLDEWGEIDPEIDYEFVPLWELDEAGAATVRKTNADTDQVLTTLGAIDPDEVRQRIAAEPDSPYAGLDLSKPAPGPPQPPGGEGGEGGMPPGGGQDTDPATSEAILSALRGQGMSDATAQALFDALQIGGTEDDAGQAFLDALRGPDGVILDTLRDKAGDPTGKMFLDALRGKPDAARVMLDALAADAAIEADPDEREALEDDEARIATVLAELGIAEDAAAWEETKHPRDDDGKFGSGGGGGGGGGKAKSHSLPDHPAFLDKYAKGMKAIVTGGVAYGETPKEIGDKIKAFVGQFAHGSIAKYGNTVLGAIEKGNGLPKGSLGEAKPKGKGATPMPAAKPAPKPAAPKPQAASPADLDEPAPDYESDMDVEGPTPHAGSVPQQAIHAIATGPGTDAEKIAQIKANSIVQGYPHGFTAQFAKEWIKALGGNTDDMGPATSPAPTPAKPKATKASGATVPGTAKGAPGVTTHNDPDVIQWASKLFGSAAKPSSTSSAGAKKIAPSLEKSFWGRVPAVAKSALTSYQGTGHHAMNGVLRGQIDPAHTDAVGKIKAVHKLFQDEATKLTEDVIMRRGVGVFDPKLVPTWKTQLAHGLPCIYTAEGFVSASMADQAAFSSKPLIFEMICRKGTRAIGVDGMKDIGENELLLSHGQQFEVYEIKEATHQTVIRMVSGKALED